MKAQVLRAGPQTTVQDLGRNGYRASGVGTGGALDPFAARIANLLVRNDEADALIEIALGNFRMRFEDERLIAWCGGDFDVQVDGIQIPPGHCFLVRANDEIVIKNPKRGYRAWLAVSGGIDVPLVLESRSTDLRAAFGGLDGRVLRDGDSLSFGEESHGVRKLKKILGDACLSSWSAQREWTNPVNFYPTLRIVRGPDWARFNEAAHDLLTSEKFIVTSEADRMGVRLDGPELKRMETSDLLSEAVAPGTMQVPPNGQLILLLGDCQTVGGYPKIAHVITVDLPMAAQLRPEDQVRFQEVSLSDAHSLLLQRERDFEQFCIGLDLKTS